jgi:hypothetical protein
MTYYTPAVRPFCRINIPFFSLELENIKSVYLTIMGLEDVLQRNQNIEQWLK